MTAPAKLDILDFGTQLLQTGDLDPVYIGVCGAAMTPQQKARWLLAYWCFYHVGFASWVSEQDGGTFWHRMRLAANNDIVSPAAFQLPGDRWPRAPERRHFRGQKCVEAVTFLANRFPRPADAVDSLTAGGNLTAASISERVRQWPLFGPWIAFKAADMIERCMGVAVRFPSDLGLIYDEPRAALDILAGEATDGRSAHWWWTFLLDHWSEWSAPPADIRGRKVGVQEVETICCKWKSHMGGHYWPGKDIHEVRASLTRWGRTAEHMLSAMPEEVSDERAQAATA